MLSSCLDILGRGTCIAVCSVVHALANVTIMQLHAEKETEEWTTATAGGGKAMRKTRAAEPKSDWLLLQALLSSQS